MLSTEEDGVLAYTLDHTEYAIDLSAFRSCDVGQLWLTTFIVSGVLLGLLFELLHLHAGPAKETTFLLPFAGYVAQGVVGLVWTTANGTWRMGNATATQANVELALKVGYRHLDCALGYDNQYGVGAAIKASGVARESLWLTSKVPGGLNTSAMEAALETSVDQLGVSYVDLMLVRYTRPDLAR